MKTPNKFKLATLTFSFLFSTQILAQTILPSIQFYRLPEAPMRVTTASTETVMMPIEMVPKTFRHPSYYRGTSSKMIINSVKQGGLAVSVELAFKATDGWDGDFQWSLSGDLELRSCLRTDGKPLFGQYNSLEAVLQEVRNPLDLQFTTCLLTGKVMRSNFTTPTGQQPHVTYENVTVQMTPAALQFSGTLVGMDFKTKASTKFASPYLYIRGDRSFLEEQNGVSIQSAQNEILAILSEALVLIQSESADKKLPQTVTYLTASRSRIASSLASIRNASGLELLNFMVTMKNAFNILDQAVGLASEKSIQMNSILGLPSPTSFEKPCSGWFCSRNNEQ